MNYASIRSLDISNGEGVGIALFVQGCHFHCFGCFNQDTWDFYGGKEWSENIESKFLDLANRDYIKRVSFLGGEPLATENLDTLLHLVNRIRKLCDHTKTIWLYSGYTWEHIFPSVPQQTLEQEEITRQLIVSQCDILVDGQYVDSLRDMNLRFKGSSNQRIIDIQKSIKEGTVVLWQ
jgi:anaerobic ribonucleoside-triphosphate reductase activating protein